MNLIWATRGRSWGFRFLLDGGYPDPLVTYERAFVGMQGQLTVCRRSEDGVALRVLDPLNRQDDAGRVIPHDFVVMESLADRINSIEDGLREVWPMVADVFDRVWDAEKPPTAQAIQTAFGEG